MTEPEIKLYEELISTLDVIFDVGTQEDSPFYEMNPDAEIHLFEPVKDYLDYLENEVKDKKHNITFNNFALGSKTETKTFYWKYGAWKKVDIEKFTGLHETWEVSVRTLNDYCDEKGITKIDYLKIDTEGLDFEVIKGGDRYLDCCKYIQFEHYGTFHNNETLDEVFDYFKGWNIYKIGGKPMNYLVTKEIVNLEQVR